MIIISDYQLLPCGDKKLLCVSSEDSALCPVCASCLKYRDSRDRIVKKHGGKTIRISIRRLKCDICRRFHNELPNILVPHKHYSSEVIEDTIDEASTPEDSATEDYPCEKTIQRWKRWISRNDSVIRYYLSIFVYSRLHFQNNSYSHFFTLENIRRQGTGWLGSFTWIVYGAGGLFVT